jgi:hypothetical protein
MTTHVLKREHSGEGISSCITPTCSCGWRGIGYEAHNDWQHAMVKDQESAHLRAVSNAVTGAA